MERINLTPEDIAKIEQDLAETRDYFKNAAKILNDLQETQKNFSQMINLYQKLNQYHSSLKEDREEIKKVVSEGRKALEDFTAKRLELEQAFNALRNSNETRSQDFVSRLDRLQQTFVNQETKIHESEEAIKELAVKNEDTLANMTNKLNQDHDIISAEISAINQTINTLAKSQYIDVRLAGINSIYRRQQQQLRTITVLVALLIVGSILALIFVYLRNG